ncbi:MAG: hypothetical protein J0L51_07005 [Rhizobiales bacterium]|nr:hypothetical protein [Hyphomicrobiales bacterium]
MLIRGFQCSFDILLEGFTLPPTARLKAVFALAADAAPICVLTSEDGTITLEEPNRLRFHFSPTVSASMPQSVVRFDFMRTDTTPAQHLGWEGFVQFASTLARP